MEMQRILIVEDEYIIANDIQMSLESMGYCICAMVASGEKAIEKAQEETPDLILMDIMLKGDMDGVEAAKEIKNRFKIPVVYLTAYADDEVLERARITGAFGYLIKPFKDRELRAAIEMALYKHQMEQEKEKLINDLQEALSKIKILSGLIPICANCKKVRDDKGYWNQIEGYIQTHSDAMFSHSICPKCTDKLYGDEDWHEDI